MNTILMYDLKDPDSALARDAFSLYEQSFPIEERDSIDYLAEQIRKSAHIAEDSDKIFRFKVAVQGKLLVALSVYIYHPIRRLAFLWYMTTNPVLRGQGIGSWLFTHILQGLTADAQLADEHIPLGMCWEVERPENAGDNPEEYALRERRIRFYERNGAVLLKDIDYIAPPPQEGLSSVPFFLMYIPYDKTSRDISPSLKKKIVDFLLLDSYGVTETDSRYQKAILSISR